MAGVQKTSLRNQMILESTALLSFAYIAGSKRFIQYFPGLSRKDLLMGASLSCVGSFASEIASREYPEEAFFIALLRKTSFVVLPTLFLVAYRNRSMSELYQHQLKLGKADPQLLKAIQLYFKSALKFGVLGRVVVATVNGGHGFVKLEQERIKREEEERVLKQQLEDSNSALQQVNERLGDERLRAVDLEARLQESVKDLRKLNKRFKARSQEHKGALLKVQQVCEAVSRESKDLKAQLEEKSAEIRELQSLSLSDNEKKLVAQLKERSAELEIAYYVMKHQSSRRAG